MPPSTEPTIPQPLGSPAHPAGFAAPAEIGIAADQLQQLVQAATEVMADPLMKLQLAQRVYELMQEDLRLQQERTHSYGGDF